MNAFKSTTNLKCQFWAVIRIYTSELLKALCNILCNGPILFSQVFLDMGDKIHYQLYEKQGL
jgi:hypothetical protein